MLKNKKFKNIFNKYIKNILGGGKYKLLYLQCISAFMLKNIA